LTKRAYPRYVEVMSVKQTEKNEAGQRRDRSQDAKYLAKLVKDGHAADLEDAKHVAKLVAKGMLTLGKPGPIPDELLRPGPPGPNSRKAIRWMKRGR
jgi:hypothetical protein